MAANRWWGVGMGPNYTGVSFGDGFRMILQATAGVTVIRAAGVVDGAEHIGVSFGDNFRIDTASTDGVSVIRAA